MARAASYIYTRNGSRNFWLRLQYPGKLAEVMGKPREERSLGTADRREAEVLAAPHIEAHKRLLLRQAHGLLGVNLLTEREGEPVPFGEHTLPSGDRVFCDGKVIHFLDGVRKGTSISNRPMLIREVRTDLPGAAAYIAAAHPPKPKAKPVTKGIDPDYETLELYLKERRINQRDADDARKVWGQFRSICDKPLAKCDRDDGRALVALLEKEVSIKGGKLLTSKTIGKKLGYLAAAVNKATKEGSHKGINPFADLAVNGRASLDRLPLSEDDMAKVRKLLVPGSEEHRLWVMLATTGMRCSEAFVAEEFQTADVRFIRTGTKTKASRREVPLTAEMIAVLPKRIEGPIFEGSAHNLGRNLNRIMVRAGITDPRKVVHSLRHRAKDRLRDAGCPVDVQFQLLGHDDGRVGSGYGSGYSVAILKGWADKIGW